MLSPKKGKSWYAFSAMLFTWDKLSLQSAGMCLPFNPSHMLHTSAATAKRFLESYDQVNN